MVSGSRTRKISRSKDPYDEVQREAGSPVSIQTERFAVEWLDSKWKEWQELQESAELKALVETTNKKIDQVSTNERKGKGKGKEM